MHRRSLVAVVAVAWLLGGCSGAGEVETPDAPAVDDFTSAQSVDEFRKALPPEWNCETESEDDSREEIVTCDLERVSIQVTWVDSAQEALDFAEQVDAVCALAKNRVFTIPAFGESLATPFSKETYGVDEPTPEDLGAVNEALAGWSVGSGCPTTITG